MTANSLSNFLTLLRFFLFLLYICNNTVNIHIFTSSIIIDVDYLCPKLFNLYTVFNVTPCEIVILKRTKLFMFAHVKIECSENDCPNNDFSRPINAVALLWIKFARQIRN